MQSRPLSDLLRPQNLSEFLGQEKLVGPEGTIYKIIKSQKLPSIIFWGPPASGKTTIAKILGKEFQADFYQLSAVMDGKDALKKIIEKAQDNNLFKKKLFCLWMRFIAGIRHSKMLSCPSSKTAP